MSTLYDLFVIMTLKEQHCTLHRKVQAVPLAITAIPVVIPAAAATAATAATTTTVTTVKLLQLFQNRIHFPLSRALFSVQKVTVAPGIDGGVLAGYFGLIINRSHGILETPAINKLNTGGLLLC